MSLERLIDRARRDHLGGAVFEHPLDEIARIGLIVDDKHFESGELGGDEAGGAHVCCFRMLSFARFHVPVYHHQGKMHRHRCALVFARAPDPDGSAVQLDEALHDGQPQSKTSVLARRDASPCRKRSNRCGMNSGAMPAPVSATLISMWEFTCSSRI